MNVRMNLPIKAINHSADTVGCDMYAYGVADNLQNSFVEVATQTPDSNFADQGGMEYPSHVDMLFYEIDDALFIVMQ